MSLQTARNMVQQPAARQWLHLAVIFISVHQRVSAMNHELTDLSCSVLRNFTYNFTLDSLTLDRSAVNPGGSTHAFNAFIHKWLHHPAGARPLNVVVQGGSFSSGLGFQPRDSFYAYRFVQTMRLLNPSVKITLTNSAVGEFRC